MCVVSPGSRQFHTIGRAEQVEAPALRRRRTTLVRAAWPMVLLALIAAQSGSSAQWPIGPPAAPATPSTRESPCGEPPAAEAPEGSCSCPLLGADGPLLLAKASPPQTGEGPRARASSLYAQGIASAAAGRYQEAVRLQERALESDPAHGDARTALGWAQYRLSDFASAETTFLEATRREPERADAWMGLGYARLQRDQPTAAREALERARALAPGDAEVLKGLALLELRSGSSAIAAALLREVLQRTPGDEEAAAAFRRALAQSGQLTDRRLRPTLADRPAPAAAGGANASRAARGATSAASPSALDAPFRAGPSALEIRRGKRWQPLFLRGVNLGVALPGRFPSEFPEDESVYRDWLSRIHAMNANVVRLYTLLPPAFYRALAKENLLHPESPLYLLQGVWVELPTDNDFSDAPWNADYAAEIRRVIDALHGNIEVAPRPGHASGLYEADVSPWHLGMILGREWEPYAVKAYDERVRSASGGKPCAFGGRYVAVAEGTSTECWIASTLEVAAAYLAEGYAVSRPLSFTNWPTLDPLHHPTEATRAEEVAILRRRGVAEVPMKGPVYDNDDVTVDASRMAATSRLPAGLFASYHVYPYYPDFLLLDPKYLAARDAGGPNAYAAYLRDLLRAHAGMPVLIAETGVPTSRGIAHKHPHGFHHGGHDERAQASIVPRLVRSAYDAGAAGVVVFSWLDEWFKHNWLFAPLETPPERNPLWHNVLDPEQNFGIMNAAAGPAIGGIVLDGRTEDWADVPPIYAQRKGSVPALYASSDEAYLYLRLDIAPSPSARAPAGFGGWTYWIGIDTYDRGRGDRRLPGLAGKLRIPSGLEYAIRLDDKDPRILVDAPYDVGSHALDGPFASVPNEEARFIPMKVEIRMQRIGRDGTVYPAERHDMSPLRAGTTDAASPRYDSLSDYFSDPASGIAEIRIPWTLLNVTDPSARRVLHQTAVHPPPLDTAITEGFVFYLAAVPPGKDRPAGERPAPGERAETFAWPTWEAPRYHLRTKALYGALRKTFGALPAAPPALSE